MSFERPVLEEEGGEQKEAERKENLRTSRRLMLALEPTRLNFSKIEVVGENHLKQIPEGAKVVIAVDHLNNLSIPTAALELGKRLPIKISNQSIQFDFRKNPGGGLGVVLGGKENFKGIDYDMATKEPKPFNPENFEDMLGSLDEGYAVIIAAHNPVNTNKLPEKAGYGAAYLAGIADAYVLPVSVSIKSEVHVMEGDAGILKNIKGTLNMVANRPEAQVAIGEPYKPKQENDIREFHALFMKRKREGRLSSEEKEEFSRLRNSLSGGSEKIMKHLAVLLPEEKQGAWKEKPEQAEESTIQAD